MFQEPLNEHFSTYHHVDSLWKLFKPMELVHNHRQGQGSKWTEMLNRFRIGEGTEEDKEVLETRRMNHFPEINFDKACHVFFTNAEVDHHNTRILNSNPNPLVQIEAVCHYPKGYTPKVTEWNTIDNTQFRKILHLKVGARVMMIFNVCISDSLINGALGRVAKIILDREEVKAIIVTFDNSSAGLEQAKNNQAFLTSNNVESGVPIFRTTLEYSLPFRRGSRTHGCMGKITQFPLRLADGSTAHKYQGISVFKNSKFVVHGHKRMPKGMGYVMLSRCASIDSVFLDENFDIDKIDCIPEALEENQNLKDRSIVSQVRQEQFDLFMVNVNRLRTHLADLEQYLYTMHL